MFRSPVRFLKPALWALSFGLLGLLAVESLARGTPLAVLAWAVERPVFALCNLALVLAVGALGLALTGRVARAVVFSGGLLVAMAAINAAKLSILGAPFLAWDLLFARQIWAMAASISTLAAVGIAVCLAGLCLLAVLTARRNRANVRLSSRAILAACAVAVAAVSQDALPRLAGMPNTIWNQAENAEVNGYLATFALNVSPLLVRQPGSYGPEVVARLLEHNEYLIAEAADGAPAKRPSLIILMSESFHDLLDVAYDASQNPLENFSRLAASHPSFRLVSPSFGGNTCNVEFEALTGLSNAFLPDGSIPYDNYLRGPVPSIAWALRGLGYRTAAVHPYHDWFWNRRSVYPNLGFEGFHALDSFKDAQTRGGLVTDEAMVDRIIEIAKADPKTPFFIHAVSMQNHGPYLEDRYGDDALVVQADAPEALWPVLSTFLTGVRDADRALARLLETLESFPEPVVCLFFGDHQPWFMLDLHKARNPEGAVHPARLPVRESLPMYSVPGLIWSNMPGLVDAADIPRELSPVHLPAILLHQMGIPLPPHMFYVRQGLRSHPVIHRNFVVTGDGEIDRFEAQRDNEFLRGLELLQYDILFGKGFARPIPTDVGL